MPRNETARKSNHTTEEQDRRAKILRSAVQTFASLGFHGSTTKELAKAAGISEALIYKYFSNKEDLFDAVLEYLLRSSSHVLAQAQLQPTAGGGDREFLMRLANSLYDHYTSKPEEIRILLYAAMQGHSLAGKFLNRQVKDIYAVLQQRIRHGQSHGRYRKMNAAAASRAFIGMINYHILIGVLFGDKWLDADWRREWPNAFVDIFLEGLEK